MRTNHIIAVIFIAFIILSAALITFLLPRFINKQKPFINNAEIVKFTQPDAKAPDITEEYHLWLKMELPSDAFDVLFKNNKDKYPKDALIKKDEMRTERLVPENVIQDMLVIKGYSNHDSITATTGLPLRINKVITLAKENLRPLYDEEPLANPQGVSRRIFQPQTDIYRADEGNKTLLYIHLESGIKPHKTSNLLSLTITYLKDNQATQTQTLALFRY